MRRNRRSRGRTAAGRPRQDSVEYRAVADQRARGLRRRGAGNRRARACRGARSHYQQGDGRSRHRLRQARRRRRRLRPRPDRRRDRRADHRQGDFAGRGQTADGGQSPRGACAHRAADRRRAVSLLPVSGLRRPHADSRGARRRRLCAARQHDGRRHRRGLRQDREASGARLSRRPAGRERGDGRQSGALRLAAPDAGTRRGRFFALGSENRVAS